MCPFRHLAVNDIRLYQMCLKILDISSQTTRFIVSSACSDVRDTNVCAATVAVGLHVVHKPHPKKNLLTSTSSYIHCPHKRADKRTVMIHIGGEGIPHARIQLSHIETLGGGNGTDGAEAEHGGKAIAVDLHVVRRAVVVVCFGTCTCTVFSAESKIK